MKKILALIITLIFAMTLLIGCNKKEEPKEEPPVEEFHGADTPSVPTENVTFNRGWKYADLAEITSGYAVLYHAENSNGKVVGINAGHGTKGGADKKIPCHPDYSGKFADGQEDSGAVFVVASSSGMTFHDGALEAEVNLQEAKILRNKLLAEGFDVLMVRDGDDVQLDNIARAVLCNNVADIHIAIHWDGDGLDYDKGCFYVAPPELLKRMKPVSWNWQSCNALGACIIEGLKSKNIPIYGEGFETVDLVQTSYSMIPAVEIELGNSASDHSNEKLSELADGVVAGIKQFFEN